MPAPVQLQLLLAAHRQWGGRATLTSLKVIPEKLAPPGATQQVAAIGAKRLQDTYSGMAGEEFV